MRFNSTDLPKYIISTISAKSSCRKNSAICDRHASCHIVLDICDCKTGYTGDGITCHDINECDAKDTPCSDGGRCLNLDGGYVCCKNGQDDATCIKGELHFAQITLSKLISFRPGSILLWRMW